MPRPPFPHMMPRDVPLFAAFAMSAPGRLFTRWQFDVHVGAGCAPPSGFDPRLFGMAIAISQLRIDAIGWDAWGPTIFEVKPDARLSAFGQVLAYHWYYRCEFGTEAKKAIITNTETYYTRQLAEQFGVEIHLVEPALPSQILQVCRALDAGDCDLLPLPPR